MSLKKFYSEKLQPLKMLYIIILYLFLIGFGQISASESTLKTDLVKKSMTLKDIMTFHAMQEEPILSEQGNWVLYSSKQNIGNHCAYLYNVRSGNTIRIERGGRPVISKDEKWIALQIRPDIITRERLKIEKEKNPPESDLRLINTITKEEIDIKSVQSYQFSKDSIYLLTKLYPKKTSKIPEQQKNEAKNQPDTDKKKAKKSILQIRHLSSGKVLRIEQVKVHVLDPSSRYLAYVQSVTDLTTNSKKKAREIFIIQDLNHQKIIKQLKQPIF